MKKFVDFGILIIALACCLAGANPSQANVCFAGDGDCGSIDTFGGYTDPSENLRNQCVNAGYETNRSECTAAKGVQITDYCPYDSNFVKCCSLEYQYDSCVYPLVKAGKCGSKYKCVCDKSYKSVAGWRSSASANCTPGGGVCIIQNDDTVYYNKCVCDTNYYPYTSSCASIGMTQVSTCRDSDNRTYYRCECPSSYRTCTYGGAAGAKECKQGGLTLYSSCASSEEACRNMGYYENCEEQKCYYANNNKDKPATDKPAASEMLKGEPQACENSVEVCPYANGFYKCRWSAANYCAQWEMREKATSLPSTCTLNGVQGMPVPCRVNGGSDGTGSGTYLGYYKCKPTCEDQVRAQFALGYIHQDETIKDKKNQPVFYREDSLGRHMYILNDVDVTTFKRKQYADVDVWTYVGQGTDYKSVNGIAALYDVDATKYSSCKDERDPAKRPTLKLDHDRIRSGETWYLNVNLSDIKVEFYCTANKDASQCFHENYFVEGNKIWNNVSFYLHPSAVRSNNKWKMGWDTEYKASFVSGNGDKTARINIKGHLTMQGDIIFDFPIQFHDRVDDYFPGKMAVTLMEFLVKKDGKVLEFKDANIKSLIYASPELNGMEIYLEPWNSTVVFTNTKGYLMRIIGSGNVAFNNSDMHISTLRVKPNKPSNPNTKIGGIYYFYKTYAQACHGIYLNNSNVKVTFPVRIANDNSKLFISKNSTLETPSIVLQKAKNHEVCNMGTLKLESRTDTGAQRIYWFKDGEEFCFGATNEGQKCSKNSILQTSGRWEDACTNQKQCYDYSVWYSGCGICENYGMGYYDPSKPTY